MHIPEDKLREYIITAKLIPMDQLDELTQKAADEQTTLTFELLKNGGMTEDDLRRIQGKIFGVPFVELKDEKIDMEILSLIPEPVARNNNIVAYAKNEKGVEVAMLDVDDLKAIDFIKKKIGQRILPRLTDSESMKEVLMQYQKSLEAEFGDIIKTEANSIQTTIAADGDEEVSEEDLKELAEDLPVVRIVDTLIKHAILQSASDIHIEALEKQVLVRYRIDGILHDAMTLPKEAGPGITARIKVLSKLKLDEKRLPQDGRFKIDTGREKVSFRVSTLPTSYGEKTVMRLLREGGGHFTLENMGFHGIGLERVHSATKHTTGMILTTGPTGSGKTTTLYTIVDLLNTPEVNISTIEDPVEYQVARINQTQVKSEIGFSFSSGLRTLLRQDPDIVMVGEIRDQETATLAVNAALTGHLVLSTLHTNSAAGTIPRFIDMGVEPFLLASTLEVIIGQRLVRRLCEEKEEYTLKPEQVKQLEKHANMDFLLERLIEEGVAKKGSTWETIPFYKPVETSQCETGYSGRIGIHEVLEMSPALRDMVTSNATSEDITEQARKEGMMTMLEDGIFKAAEGITTIEEVLRVVSE